MIAYRTGSDPIETGNLWLKVKVTVTQYPFFLHNSLLTFLLWISALLSPIKMKLVSCLDMPFVGLYLYVINIEWVMMSLWRFLCYLQTIVNISIYIEPTKFILGTNIQQH